MSLAKDVGRRLGLRAPSAGGRRAAGGDGDGDRPGGTGGTGGAGGTPAVPAVGPTGAGGGRGGTSRGGTSGGGSGGPAGRRGGAGGSGGTAPSTVTGRELLVAAAWLVTAALAIIAVGRLVHLDDAITWPYTVANALTPLLYLPVYAALAIGFALRRGRLMMLCGLVAVAHLFWAVPELFPGGPENAPQGSARLRVMTANLLYHNAEAGRLGDQIRRASPDVLVLVELSPLTLTKLRDSGALADYRYSEVHPQEGAFGAAVFSRFPLSDAATPEVAGYASLRATVRVDERRSFVVHAVHTIAPTSGEYARAWRDQLDHLRAEVAASRLPVVLAGDFNATRDNRPLRELISAGVRDAHDVVGAGWTPTWNASMFAVPPIARIDHILASPAFAITGYQVGSEFGSDHKPVLADLAMR
ncbi:endonuclease/exonuclease/phosphatase family protein [Frankia sp. R43]|uniref:endonuclease/exonuclease/phosphatase family protein n=1 Tax=Frankia sp. R43 TaxID=269536 RepID=UPI000A7F129B|nr:endonuclease/exonuclease/phosphatase family protein [Frankia sp. R43]